MPSDKGVTVSDEARPKEGMRAIACSMCFLLPAPREWNEGGFGRGPSVVLEHPGPKGKGVEYGRGWLVHLWVAVPGGEVESSHVYQSRCCGWSHGGHWGSHLGRARVSADEGGPELVHLGGVCTCA